jgi:adenylate cyclase
VAREGDGGGSDLVGGVADWLMAQALGETELEELFSGCCARLRATGIPLARCFLGFRILHPLFTVMSLRWHPDKGISSDMFGGSPDGPGFHRTPYAHMVRDRIPNLRRRLAGRDAVIDYPQLADIRDEGMTDFLAYVVAFGEGPTVTNGVIGSWATDRESGFNDIDIAALLSIQSRLAVACKVRIKDMIARNVVSTYLGADAGLKVLGGSIKRGDGETIHAVVWYSDLRNSTALAESLSPDAYIAALNAYFECTAGAVLAHGGEVLLLIGDAVMAIFPTGATGVDEACRSALDAAHDAERRLGKMNAKHAEPLDFGVGLHVGDLMFGNIGVPERLQFTVVGPAANEVARVQALTKILGRRILVSRDFADALDLDWESLGRHQMQGIAEAREVFAPTPAHV